MFICMYTCVGVLLLVCPDCFPSNILKLEFSDLSRLMASEAWGPPVPVPTELGLQVCITSWWLVRPRIYLTCPHSTRMPACITMLSFSVSTGDWNTDPSPWVVGTWLAEQFHLRSLPTVSSLLHNMKTPSSWKPGTALIRIQHHRCRICIL